MWEESEDCVPKTRYVCVCVCVYVCICICTCIYIYIYIHTHTHTHSILYSRAHWVRRVLPGGPAAKNGICEGDVISSIWKIGDRRLDEAGGGWGCEGGGDGAEEEASGKFGRGLKAFRKTGERDRVGGGLADEDVEGLLIGLIGDRVALKVVSTSKGGGGEGGGKLVEVLRQRVGKVVVRGDVSGGRGGGGIRDRGQDQSGLRRWLFFLGGGGGGEMRGRACTVWDCEHEGMWGEGGGGRCVEEGERVVEVKMGRVRSEEAVWGKVLFSKRGRADLRSPK
jgi:hypothetical protein